MGKLNCNLKLSPPRRVCLRIIRIYSLGKVSKPLYFKQSYSLIKWRTVILRNQQNHQLLNRSWYILTVFIRTQKVGSYNYAVETRLTLQRSDRSPLQMLQKWKISPLLPPSQCISISACWQQVCLGQAC